MANLLHLVGKGAFTSGLVPLLSLIIGPGVESTHQSLAFEVA